MPVIDLGRVIGPQGPQGATGAQGIRGVQGLPGPNQVTSSTATPLSGVLVGNGSVVGVESIDTEPTEDSTGFVTSGAVKEALDENQAQIATVENGNIASRAYAVGEYFCWNGLLYRATAAIAKNGAFTPGTNCEASTVGSFLYDHEYPSENWFALAAGQTLKINIGGSSSASGLANLLMTFSSNVNSLNGGLAYIKIIDYRLNMHTVNFLFGALPVDIVMNDVAGEISFTNNTTGSGTCNINIITLGARWRNITFSVT